jgi:hypothetical protein
MTVGFLILFDPRLLIVFLATVVLAVEITESVGLGDRVIDLVLRVARALGKSEVTLDIEISLSFKLTVVEDVLVFAELSKALIFDRVILAGVSVSVESSSVLSAGAMLALVLPPREDLIEDCRFTLASFFGGSTSAVKSDCEPDGE